LPPLLLHATAASSPFSLDALFAPAPSLRRSLTVSLGPPQVLNVLNIKRASGDKPKPAEGALVFSYDSWPYLAKKAYDYLIGCHYGHTLDFSFALLAYALFFTDWLGVQPIGNWEETCKTFKPTAANHYWVPKVRPRLLLVNLLPAAAARRRRCCC